MGHLYQRIAVAVAAWRNDGYPSEQFPAIAEILEWAGETDDGLLRFLRRPQLHALETYWYLRLVQGTARISDLYADLYPEDKISELLDALDVSMPAFEETNFNLDQLRERTKGDDDFVKRHRLEALRETLTLDYPSYILALAMGAGKTILIGAIIATEFAMAQEYPEGPFVQNALVFAPGKTIIESLRELTQVPYDRILPPRMSKGFAASVKITFTRDGEKDIPVIRGSAFNVVVTNTEKIRIQKETIRASDVGQLLVGARVDNAKAEIANLRLQAIASLPHLAVFSDEAHHTYGQSLEAGLKKVRKTVDYLAATTNVVCVINTTGTPYFRRQPLKDVVIWYGLSQGINEGILKEVAGSIRSYDFDGKADVYVRYVIEDFFRDYGEVSLPNGAPAKLALYFPQNDDLKELRPTIDAALVQAGLSPALCLVNTSDTSLTKPADIDAFNRLNDPAAPHRVILLVNKGTEGWNCPSLFACALARKLRSSNNFVLQAASRCLRQVPGNTEPARIYLSGDNYGVLDRQLAETYGETIAELNQRMAERRTRRLVVRKLDIAPIRVLQRRTTVTRSDDALPPLHLSKPTAASGADLQERTYTLADAQAGKRVLRQLEDTVTITTEPDTVDVYAAAVDLGARYRLDVWAIHDELRRLYGHDGVTVAHLTPLAEQIEAQTRAYGVHEELVERALALVKIDGFRAELGAGGEPEYVTEITYPVEREALLLSLSDLQTADPNAFGFHYDPYNFDTKPERHLFDDVLRSANLHPDQVEDIYFTGGITDPNKTEFFVEYRDVSGKVRRYFPDFVVRRKPDDGGEPGSGKVLIIEVKSEREREAAAAGPKGMAMKEWQSINPERIRYKIISTSTDAIPADGLEEVRAFMMETIS